ncbi:MAG: DUF4923 family protein [Clostridia bacterium]|nr:DUF4923 family protein [Clostridia bacterium]
MKKLLAILMALALMLTMLTVMAGCGDDEKKDDNDDENITQNVDDDDDDKKDDEKEDEDEDEEDGIVGTWNMKEMCIDDMSMEESFEWLYGSQASEDEIEAMLEAMKSSQYVFNQDGTFEMKVLGQSVEGEYEFDGEELLMVSDGETVVGKAKLKGDKLTITSEAEYWNTEVEETIVFERD